MPGGSERCRTEQVSGPAQDNEPLELEPPPQTISLVIRTKHLTSATLNISTGFTKFNISCRMKMKTEQKVSH